MNTVIYRERRTYSKYDDNHYLCYLNEAREPFEDGSNTVQTDVTGYAYTGGAEDGGTLIEAKEATYPAFVSGLVRLEYSIDSVEAVNANRMAAIVNPEHEKSGSYVEAWNAYQAYRTKCKDDAKYLLDMDMEG